MTGVHVRTTLDTSGWSSDLRGKIRRVEDPAPFLKAIGEEMLGRIQRRFKGEVDPDGQKWPRLSPVTIALRENRRPGAPIAILRATGALAGSIAYQVDARSLTIGTAPRIPYAAIHQFGGQAGRNRKVTIPARPFLGFGDEDVAIIEQEALEWFGG